MCKVDVNVRVPKGSVAGSDKCKSEIFLVYKVEVKVFVQKVGGVIAE